ncbi:MAG: flagellar hook-associated protein FlgK [Acidobacteriaceae bacterium]|nr:flagellar hook-associated protein FlgK [Acidobacteriaceae bacterium]
MSIGSLASLMSLAGSALDSTQKALNVTAQNVANQNTAGYTRRVVSFQDSVSVSAVNVSVTQQRDPIVEQRLANQTQVAQAASSKLSALNDLQSVFPVNSSGSTALGSALDGLWTSFASLEANPSDTATRQAVLSAAGSFASAMNSAASQLDQQISGINTQIGGIATNINSLSKTIAGLNQQILEGRDTDGSISEQRQQAITQLSNYLGVTVTPNTDNAAVTVTASNGAVLVSGPSSYALDTSSTSGLTGGQIGGMVAVRDGALATARTALDQLATSVANAVNTQNAAGVDANGSSGGAIFSSPSSATGFAANIKVVMASPSGIAAAASGEGSGGNGNASALAALKDAKNTNGETGGDFLAAMLSEIGAQASAASTDNTAQNATLTQIQSQRDAVSGVSLDEEAANLTMYQKAYQANARIFAVADKLMAEAINLGQETTVS